MTCSNCDKTDGMVYTSLPPKIKCKISNHFHEIGDECEFEWKPVIHGYWKDLIALARCSYCGMHFDHEEIKLYNYCPWCGTKMDEVEDE